jgi:endonuclease/exonuclease/phosphatase family metal-dependent hydrolase
MPDPADIVTDLPPATEPSPDTNRLTVAQFNIRELTTDRVQRPDQKGPMAAAALLQTIDPDILLVNELSNSVQQEWDGPHNATSFYRSYLRQPLPLGLEPLTFAQTCFPRSNTGVPTGEPIHSGGFTLEPGCEDYANNCHGYGEYPGRYAMALYSKFPIETDNIRTIRTFPWQALPDSKLPPSFRDTLDEAGVDLRLSSKTHADVPLRVGDTVVHALIAHPTPPRFDDDRNINGRRCHDEIRLLGDYISGAEYLTETDAVEATLPADEPFVVLGDLNAAPNKADDTDNAVNDHLLDNPRIDLSTDALPTSPGARERGDAIATHRFETADGECRIKKADYVLPSTEFDRLDAGVVWPESETDRERYRETVFAASDHHLVYRTLHLPT